MNSSVHTDTWARALKIISIVAFVGALAFIWWPRPEPTLNATGRRRSEEQIEKQIQSAKANLELVRAKLGSKAYALASDQIGPKALAAVSGQAARSGLTLMSFRPQKPVLVEEMEQVGFTATLNGPYLDVVRFVRSLESTESKLAVSSVQLNTQDSGDGNVVAAIGIVAFTVPPKEKTVDARTARRAINAGL